MPKQKITKEDVVNAAFELAKEYGPEYITVKKISEKLACSVQPIYTYCANMEGLKREVNEKVRAYIKKYVSRRVHGGDIFKETGQAYLKLAKEEPNIYKMFTSHKRENVSSLEDLYKLEADPQIAEIVSKQLEISLEKAKTLHLNMLIYSIGIGMIFSRTFPGIPAEEIFAQQEHAFKAFLAQAQNGEVEKEKVAESDCFGKEKSK